MLPLEFSYRNVICRHSVGICSLFYFSAQHLWHRAQGQQMSFTISSFRDWDLQQCWFSVFPCARRESRCPCNPRALVVNNELKEPPGVHRHHLWLQLQIHSGLCDVLEMKSVLSFNKIKSLEVNSSMI